MKIFWHKSDVPESWKLQVLDAIIKSKLVYGLETIELTPVQCNRLNAFQNKCLRRALQIPPTFIDRGWTNEKVLELASVVAGKEIKPFSENWRQAKFRLLGHILRTDYSDPLRQVTFEQNSCLPRQIEFRRRGAPRRIWIEETMKEAWEALFGHLPSEDYMEYELENEWMNNMIEDMAQQRDGIFKTKPKKQINNLFAVDANTET